MPFFGRGGIRKPNKKLMLGQPRVKVKTNASRLRLFSADYGDDWPEASKRCIELAGGKCKDCGRKATRAHHIVPRSRGGTNAQRNLRAQCSTCHDKKHSHLR